MYEAFYGFKEKPFTIVPDPAFLYLGEEHSLAYAILEYGVVNRAGLTVITGDVGCGKTTLIKHLLNQFGPDAARVGVIPNAQKNFGELMQWILMAFGLDYRYRERIELFDRFQQFLNGEHDAGRRTVLIIDEAQNLQLDTLEELRMLLNLTVGRDQLLQLILVGQPKLRQLLRHEALLQLAQRVSADFHLQPLSQTEAIGYIRHRLGVAGRIKPLVSDDACLLLHRAARGVPRVINILADTSLVYGYAAAMPVIDKDVVYAAVKDKAMRGSIQLNHLIKRQQAVRSEAELDKEVGRAMLNSLVLEKAVEAQERPAPINPQATGQPAATTERPAAAAAAPAATRPAAPIERPLPAGAPAPSRPAAPIERPAPPVSAQPASRPAAPIERPAPPVSAQPASRPAAPIERSAPAGAPAPSRPAAASEKPPAPVVRPRPPELGPRSAQAVRAAMGAVPPQSLAPPSYGSDMPGAPILKQES
jgi:type II secretory pathway predicted ATPase ExeA